MPWPRYGKRTDCALSSKVCSNGACVESGTGTQDNPFIVNHLKADVWFASQGDGDFYFSDGTLFETKPYIKLNGNKVGESEIYGDIFEGSATLKNDKNVVELYSNWEDKDRCSKIRGDESDGAFVADAVVAVLRLENGETVQTDSSWEQQDRTVGNWTSPPAVVYSDFSDGGCNMGSAMPMSPFYWRPVNNPWTDKEMCINSHACRDNCCLINVRKEFWVRCEDIDWTPSPDSVCAGQTFTQTGSCGGTRTATGTKPCAPQLVASVAMRGSGNMGDTTHFDYTSTISETGGNVGAYINSRQKCFYWEEYGVPMQDCDDIRYNDIADFYGTNHIIPNGEITRSADWVDLKNGYSYVVTETFWGVDDYLGNDVEVSYSFSVTA